METSLKVANDFLCVHFHPHWHDIINIAYKTSDKFASLSRFSAHLYNQIQLMSTLFVCLFPVVVCGILASN